MKQMSGLQWYKKVYNFLLRNESYLLIAEDDFQKSSIINIINNNNGEGIRLKSELKKCGIYISRGRRGNAAVVTKSVAIQFCDANNLDFNNELEGKKIVRYTAKDFQDSRRLKNIRVHRGKKIPKNISYHDQLKTKEWNDYRKVIFSQKGKVCQMCGRKTYLQVHHIRYIYGRKAWEYPPEDVIVLCRDCHKKVHNIT